MSQTMKNRYGTFALHSFAHQCSDNTKLIYIESPSNPLLRVIDVEAIGQLGKKRNVLTVIDNTFATPINMNPIQLGIDIVVHR
jgi:cystathionine beta-lyase